MKIYLYYLISKYGYWYVEAQEAIVRLTSVED